MSFVKHLQVMAVAALLTVTGLAHVVTVTAAEVDKMTTVPGNGEFDGANFTCLNYTNGLGDNASSKSQSILGHLWMQGFLTGLYKARGQLTLSADKADTQVLSSLMLQRCRDNPGVSILGVSLNAIGKDVYKIPAKTIVDFDLSTYTCGQQLDARSGSAGEGTKADLAELWAFAFIQGYKNATTADMVIPMENKAVLIGAVNKYCRGNRDMTFLDMTALVAEKVKLQ